MERTQKLQWPFPSGSQKGWFPLFEEMMTAIDADIFSAIDCMNIVIYGGDLSLDAGSDTLSWSEDIGVFSMLTGFKTTILAGELSEVVDGSVIYLDASRPMDSITTGTLSVGSSLRSIRDKTIVAKRVGSDLLFNNATASIISKAFSMVNAAAVSRVLALDGPAGSVMSVDWGDGSSVENVTMKGGVPTVASHTYTDADPYDLVIGKNLYLLEKLLFMSGTGMSFSLSDFGRMPGLKRFSIDDVTITGGSLADIASAPDMEFFRLVNSDVTGSLVQLAGLSSIIRIELDDNPGVSGAYTDLSPVSDTLEVLRISDTGCSGGTLSSLLSILAPSPVEIGVGNIGVTGDFSEFEPYESSLKYINIDGNTGMDTGSPFPNLSSATVVCTNCSWTETQVDNFFINADNAGCTSCGFEIITGNTARSSASDTAVSNLQSRGCTIT